MKKYLYPVLCISVFCLFFFSCKRQTISDGSTDELIQPVDPSTAETVGFFLDDWKERTFETPSFENTDVNRSKPASEIVIDASKIITKVTPAMLGQNSVSFIENLSDDPVLMQHLKALKPNVIRFPGGSRSDVYFWNRSFQDKPADVPDSLYNGGDKEEYFKWNYWYGKGNPAQRANLEDYYNLLRETGSQGMITVNYGYARYGLSVNPVAQAAHLAAEWVRYDNGRTKYWEIGNESHGAWENGFRINTRKNKDGQPEYLTGTLYAQHCKVFIDSMKKAAAEIGKQIYIGLDLAELAGRFPLWNQGVLTEMKAGTSADFYNIHSYYLTNTENTYGMIVQSALNKTATMADFIKSEFVKNGEKTRPIALTEYNIFAVGSAGSMQQVSFVNGMHTTLVLGEAIKNKIGCAVRWDLANKWEDGADHGMFNVGDEPGADKWNPRPVFYYMYYFQKMFGDRMLQSVTYESNVHTYASSFSSGHKAVVIVNKTRDEKNVKIVFKNAKLGAKYYWYALTGGTDNGDFSRSVFVNGIGPAANKTGGPVDSYAQIKANASDVSQGIYLTLPPRSVVFVGFDK